MALGQLYALFFMSLSGLGTIIWNVQQTFDFYLMAGLFFFVLDGRDLSILYVVFCHNLL